MKRFTTIAVLTATMTAALAATASASPASHSEAATREAAGIPASVVYLKGTAFWVDTDVRCFQAEATKRVIIQGQPVRAGRNVGYCTDGYVDRSKGTQYVVINAGR